MFKFSIFQVILYHKIRTHVILIHKYGKNHKHLARQSIHVSQISLELPAVNVLSKMDLLNSKNKELIEEYLQPNAESLLDAASSTGNTQFEALTRSIAQIVGYIRL